MANRELKIVNTREEKLAALKEARNKHATIWYKGVNDVPIGTHLFKVANDNIFGIKHENSPTKGLFKFPIVAGVLTVSGTGKQIVFGTENTLETNHLFVPEKFHHLIKEGRQVYLTIGLNQNQWTEVVSVTSV